MNFLLDTIGGGDNGDDDGDGWDDDFGDLSDQSLDDEQQQEVGEMQQTNNAQTKPPPPPPPPRQGNTQGNNVDPSNLSMGGGMFMGRLTRFIDAVTQPDDNDEDYEEQDGDGWNDDDDDLGLDDDEEEADNNNNSNKNDEGGGDGWDEDDDDLNFDDELKVTNTPQPPPPPPPAAPPEQRQQQQQQPAESNVPSFGPPTFRKPDAIVPLNDLADAGRVGLHVVDHTPSASSSSRYNRNVSFDASLAVVGSVQTLEDDNLGTSTATDVPSSSDGGGWDDNDDGLDDLNLDDDEQQPPASSSKGAVVDHTPPAPPPPPPPAAAVSNTTSTSSVGVATNVAVADSTQSSGGWDDEDDGLFDDIDVDGDGDGDENNKNNDTNQSSTDQQSPVQMLDHTPPPPPPPEPTRESSLTVSFGGTSDNMERMSRMSALTNAWDDVDEAVLDAAEEGGAEKTQMVDVTPPPPPPPRDGRGQAAGASEMAIAATDDGWGDDDDLLGDANSDVTPVVDHTPPPPPPPHRSSTNAAVLGDDDDISRDSTLSVDNSKSNLAYGTSIGMTLSDDGSRSKEYQANMVDRTPSLLSPVPFKRTETTEAVRGGVSIGSSTLDEYRQSSTGDSSVGDGTAPSTNVVDHTPSLATNPENQSAVDPSLLVLAGNESSIGESLGDSLDNSRDPQIGGGEQRSKLAGKMVDHTPTTRLHRQQVDVSLAVAGHTSVGESLDSIDEEEEEMKQPDQARQADPTPEFEDYNVSVGDPVDIPFGSAVTPTAAGSGTPMPLVDHMPMPLTKSQSIGVSVQVLSVSSEEGELGESDDDVDDIKDALYGQVVDHTPETPGQPTESQTAQDTPAKTEDDTVLGVASRRDVEFDLNQEEGMDDESSKGTQGTSVIGTLDDTEVRSLLGGSSVRLPIVEEKKLVDHVPETNGQRPADASTMVLADASSRSSQGDDNVVNDDETAPAGFGPIVDHTPSVMHHQSASARSVATSVVTQTSGLEADIKMDEEMETTTIPGAVPDNGESDRQSSRTPLPVVEEGHLVDRVPKRRQYRGQPIDSSVRVLPDNNDDLTQVDTIAEEEVVNFGPIVDQTPFSARSASGAASLTQGSGIYGLDGDTKPDDDDMETMTAPGGASLDGASGWDHDEPDLEDISAAANGPPSNFPGEESNLVDHVPRRSFARSGTDASMAVMFDPTDAVSQADDNDTNAPNIRFGPVVDHTPLTPTTSHHAVSVGQSMLTQVSVAATDIARDEDGMDGTWFGASTIGGVSTDGALSAADASSSAGDGSGWNEDMEAFDDLASPTTTKRPLQNHDNHVVDHIPSITSPKPTDASTTAVVIDPSVISAQIQEDSNDQNIDVGTFGAVVDHTPSVRAPSHYSVANSMITQITGLATDIKRDEEMDENTLSAGGSNEGWGQDEAELEVIADAVDDDEMPPLVDHVPERPESRPTDASTLVAADPSEMNSQVDDFGQDEENFGPVVDQTPVPRSNAAPSATTGSTIVASPSVLDDDLDDAVDKAINGDDRTDEGNQTEWQGDQNPQSGNDDSSRENLVDFLPPDDEMPELVHDGSSEMATVGEKSVLPADEPKEDEFGPVVDHTPIPDSLLSPSAEQRRRRREEESKKSGGMSSSGAQNVDSVAPLFSVASSESKDDGTLEEEFGPVVDQLPAATASKSTLSRGGSTVDALATVSEVDNDLNDGDGWEEDTDIGAGDQGSPSAASRPGDDRNLSVKWIDRLSEKDSVALLQKTANVSRQSNGTSDSGFYDAVMGDTSKLSLNETRYYDPELGDSNTWNDGLDALNDLADEDDTPPSTPRQSLDLRGKTESAPIAPGVQDDCGACATATTSECPCVQSLIDSNRGTGNMIGRVKTPEGDMVNVDFEKLLETEVTRRRLVETECEALRSTIESLKASKTSLTQAAESQMTALNKLHGSNNELTDNLDNLKQECDKLRLQNENVESKNRKLSNDVSNLESEQQRWSEKEDSLKVELESFRSRLLEASTAASEQLSSRESELKSEIADSKKSKEEMYQQKMQLDTECENLRGKNESLYEDLEAYRQSISKLEERNASLSANESALNAEVTHLKTSLENQAVSSSSTSQLEDRLRSIQSNHASKTAECEELKSQVAQLQQRLTSSEADNFKHTKDLAKISRDHSQEISKLEQQALQSKKDLDEALRVNEVSTKEFTEKLSIESAASMRLREEKASLETDRQALVDSHARNTREHQHKLQYAQEELRSSNSRIAALEEEKDTLSSEVRKLTGQLKTAESQTLEFLSVSRDRDVVQEALVESKATIANLQSRLNLSAGLESQVNGLRQQLQESTNERMAVEAERSHMAARLMDLESLYKNSEVERESSIEKCSFVESELSKTLEKLRALSSENESLVAERGQLQNQMMNLKEASQRAEEEARLYSDSSVANQNSLMNLQAERDRLKQESDQLSNMNADQQQRIQALQNELAEVGSLVESKDQIIVSLEEQQRATQSNSHQLLNENEELRSTLQGLEESISKFGTERDRLVQDSQQNDSTIQKLNEEIAHLIEERDSIRREHSAMAEENEELFVQFGLCKEQMDAYEDQHAQMQDELLTRESTVTELETKLIEAQRGIDDLAASVADQNVSNVQFESMREKWAEEKKELEQQLEEVVLNKSDVERSMQSASEENRRLSELVPDMQKKFDDLVSASKAKERQLVSIIDSMEEQCTESKDKCHVLERELDLKNSDLEKAQAAGQDIHELRQQVDELQLTLSENQRLLQQKDAALQDLQFQLQHAGNAPQSSAELDTLRRTVQNLEGSAVKDRQAIREFETQLHGKQEELDRALRELSSANLLAEQLQKDVESRKQTEIMTRRSLEDTLRKSEDNLDAAQREFSRLKLESEERRNTIAALQSELSDRHAAHQSSKEAFSKKSAEIESLREEIAVLRTQQEKSSKELDTRETMIEEEVHQLQREMQTKDSQLQKMEHDLHMLSNDLSESHVDLASKQEEVERLTSELEDLKQQSNQPATSKVLGHTQDSAESDEKMRSNIIALANALEKSEGNRAEAIENLEKERKAHADSLRRLAENVKRFYSTLSVGDS